MEPTDKNTLQVSREMLLKILNDLPEALTAECGTYKFPVPRSINFGPDMNLAEILKPIFFDLAFKRQQTGPGRYDWFLEIPQPE